jgi:hypothetical protein
MNVPLLDMEPPQLLVYIELTLNDTTGDLPLMHALSLER